MPHKDTSARRAYHRQYKRLNKERLKPMNADSDRARHANQRAAKYGAPGRVTIEDVRAVMAAGVCHYCGGDTLLGIDHVIPLHEGGPNERANLVCCCRPCNASKWRADRPGRWSREHDACIECRSTDRAHVAQGYCSRCYQTRGKPTRDRNPRAKIGPDEVRQIRRRHAAGDSYAVLMAAYGLSKPTVSKIVLRRTWANLA